MKRGHDSDPAWSRGGNNLKNNKRKMCSRASLRLLSTLIRRKRAADKTRNRDNTICATRTVELPSTQNIGDDKNKLLFMLAIGLVPNSKKDSNVHPIISVERLDSRVEAEAKARTKEIIYEIFKRRKAESLQRRLVYHDPMLSHVPPHTYIDDRHSQISSLGTDVEVVNLVSSDDESYGSSEEETAVEGRGNSSMLTGAYNSNLYKRTFPQVDSNFCDPGNYRIITASINARKPVFKPLGNNQDSGIFRNWKPESMTRLMTLNTGNAEKDDRSVSLKGSQSKLLSSLKSIPATSTLTVRKFPSTISAGNSCKSHVHGVLEDTPSSTNVDYIVPDTLITID